MRRQSVLELNSFFSLYVCIVPAGRAAPLLCRFTNIDSAGCAGFQTIFQAAVLKS